MPEETALENLTVLVVDDETDVLETVEDLLEACIVHKASTYEEALQYLLSYTYDVVILDIMGVNGFSLLRESVNRGFPTIMFTAHALSTESLKKSIQLGAVSFLPKEKAPELPAFIRDVVLSGGRPVWKKLFTRLEETFNVRFGPDWKEKDRFFREFEESLQQENGRSG